MAKERSRSWRPVIVGLAAIVVVSSAGAARSANNEPLLELGHSGDTPVAREFGRVARIPAVQQLLLDVASVSRTGADIEAALRDSGVTVKQLEELKLIRLHGARYELAFSLLTREDAEKIHVVAEREGARLATLLVGHRQRIEALVTESAMPSADWRATAFFILGCVSLDWDGLNWVEEKRYLTGPPEGGYLPTARQPPPRDAVRQLYWGSHNYHDRAAVTTFGDHYSLPRTGLPDLFWRMNLEGPEPVKSKARRAAEGLVRRHAAAVMLALRDGPRRVPELVAMTSSTEADTKDVLELLVALQYVKNTDGLYTAVIPVLTERDRSMVRELRLLGRQAFVRWFDERYQPLCSQLADITPRRYGLPLSDSFYWVWHPVFAVANRELVKAGLFADPYSSERTFQGFIPAVYQLDVVQGPF